MLDSQTGMKLYAPDNISAEDVRKYNMQSEPAPAVSRFVDGKPQNPFENRGKNNFEDRRGNPAFTRFRNMFEPTPDPVEIAAKQVMQTDSMDIKKNVASVINEKVENNPKVTGISDDSWENMPIAQPTNTSSDTQQTTDQFISNKNLSINDENQQVTRVQPEEDSSKSAAATIQGTGAAVKEAVSEIDTSVRPDFLQFQNFYNNPGELTLNPTDETSSEYIKNQREMLRSTYYGPRFTHPEYENINLPGRMGRVDTPVEVQTPVESQPSIQPNINLPDQDQDRIPTQPTESSDNINFRSADFQDSDFDGIDDRDQYQDRIPTQVDDITPPITSDFDGIDERRYRDRIPTQVDDITPPITETQSPSDLPIGSGIPYFDSAKIQEFVDALNKAKERGQKEFEWNGVKYQTGVTEEPPKEVTPESPDITPTTGGTTPTTGGTTPTTGGTTPTTGGNTDGTTPPGSDVKEKPKPTQTSLSIGNLLSRIFTGKPAVETSVTGNTATPAPSTAQGLSVSTPTTQSVAPQSIQRTADLTPTSSQSIIYQGTEGILKTQAENASMTSPMTVAQSQQPVIINNTTMIPQAPPMEKVREVFSDESTFTRLVAQDIYHPSFRSG